MQEHEEAISEIGFVPHFQEIDVEYDPGTTINVEMHDAAAICVCANCMRTSIRPTALLPFPRS
jgi:hypothetical protein